MNEFETNHSCKWNELFGVYVHETQNYVLRVIMRGLSDEQRHVLLGFLGSKQSNGQVEIAEQVFEVRCRSDLVVAPTVYVLLSQVVVGHVGGFSEFLVRFERRLFKRLHSVKISLLNCAPDIAISFEIHRLGPGVGQEVFEF